MYVVYEFATKFFHLVKWRKFLWHENRDSALFIPSIVRLFVRCLCFLGFLWHSASHFWQFVWEAFLFQSACHCRMCFSRKLREMIGWMLIKIPVRTYVRTWIRTLASNQPTEGVLRPQYKESGIWSVLNQGIGKKIWVEKKRILTNFYLFPFICF